MWIIKKIFEWLRKFFASKAGRTTAKAMVGAGAVGAGGYAAGKVVAHKRNKRAEIIKARALKKHDEACKKVEEVLQELGQIKLAINKDFECLADAIERIQQRPEFKFSVEGIDLPQFQPVEYKRLANALEAAVGGAGGALAGSAVGVAIMGTGTIVALAPGALAGGVVLCVMGVKMMNRAAENVN